jgi:potassium-dependent mechanosensitive channel
LKYYTLWYLQVSVIFFLGFWTPATAAKTDQTHLSKIVKTKQLLLVETTRHIDKILPAKMARIRSYEATLADYLARAHQLRFLISVSESNPFEVRLYFKQATELLNGLERETRSIRSMAQEIRINLSIVETARKDLRFISETAVSMEQKENAQSLLRHLERFKNTQLKLKKPLQAVLNRTDEAKKLMANWDHELEREMAAVWSIYFTKPLFRLYDKDFLEKLRLSIPIWLSTMGPTLESKLPDSPSEWAYSFIALLVFGVIFHFIFKWLLGRIGARSDGNQDQWIVIYRTADLPVSLFCGFWSATIIGVFPENIVFSRLAVIFGAWAAITLGWGLRNIKLRSGVSSPLYPLFCLFAAGIIIQITNMPMRELGVLWPLGVGIMMFFMWRSAGKYENPGPRRLVRFCFWCGFPIMGLSLAGFTFPSVEIFLTIFLCSILHQFASALSDLIRRRLARMQEKGNPLINSVCISLGIPLIWFLAVGIILLWLADQFGQSEIMKLTDGIQLTWQDIDIGFLQIVAAVALFFVIKPVMAVLKGAVYRVAQKSNVDEAVMMPVQTVLVYGVWGIYGLLVLHIIGVRLSSILVLAGGMSVGIGFGLQHIINNFVSGVILLFGRSVRPGDVIEHELVLGEVEKVTIRNTLVRTRNDTTMLIPNSNLVSMPFVNMSRDSRAVRLIVAVGVDYNSDPFKVEHLLLEAALEHPDVLKNPAPRVRFENFQDSYLDFRLKFWVDFNGSKRVASDLRFAILKKFREQGVEMAFPQMDLHVKDLIGKSTDGPVEHPV